LPGTVASTAQCKQSEIEDGRQAASVRARAVIDGENAVIRWREQQDRLHPTQPHTRRWQVRSTRRPGSKSRPEASGMWKAGDSQSRQGWANSEPGGARSAKQRRKHVFRLLSICINTWFQPSSD